MEFDSPYLEICCGSYLEKSLGSDQSSLLLRSLSPAKNGLDLPFLMAAEKRTPLGYPITGRDK
jgi:hypothetical protein